MISVADYYLQKIRDSYTKPTPRKHAKPKQSNPINTLPGEEWLPVKNHPHYLISNFGRIQSTGHTTPRLMKLSPIRHGNNHYFKVTLCNKGNRTDEFIHRLVYETFTDTTPEKIWHINRDTLDNRLENLENITQAELNRRTKSRQK